VVRTSQAQNPYRIDKRRDPQEDCSATHRIYTSVVEGSLSSGKKDEIEANSLHVAFKEIKKHSTYGLDELRKKEGVLRPPTFTMTSSGRIIMNETRRRNGVRRCDSSFPSLLPRACTPEDDAQPYISLSLCDYTIWPEGSETLRGRLNLVVIE